ncbi:DUF2993 domain-containing protein [Nodosilinea sp. P-1105]|uniref:LmeA family phospholipid-binding protein n=1 Tax=Nodosilinea sp. P-1105 TaxID=2546229 RepID=UPI00146F7F86|nr:DUF2993 domain-containing protein [Nodosilinea sp. P-1105]NMF84278.1 DUF2993 domain-containing protein [Nodosilinea sp. P-1105]
MPSNSISSADNRSTSSVTSGRGSRLISRILSPAIRLWLQTQLDHIEGLDFRVNGSDRQILSGHVPQVTASAQQAIYRGLHVSQVTVAATDIYVNLGQIVRGKPLKLLRSFPVSGQIAVQAADLQASLGSALLGDGLQDLLQRLWHSRPELNQWSTVASTTRESTPSIREIQLGADQCTLVWAVAADQFLAMEARLTLVDGRWLCLQQPTLTLQPPDPCSGAANPIVVDDVRFDLGPETDIQTLTVTPAAITLEGTVQVIAAT